MVGWMLSTMGLTFFKGIRAGPFRFNLSGSGLGISTGIKGFRIGTGPRGTYISMGAGGFRYRTYLHPERSVSSQRIASRHAPFANPDPTPKGSLDEKHSVEMTTILSADAAALIDESSAQFLNDLNDRSSRNSLVTITNVFAFLIAAGLIVIWCQNPNSLTPIIAFLLAFVCYLICIVLAYYADLHRLQTVLMFDADDDFQSRYQSVLNAFQRASNCTEIKHVRAQGVVSIQDRRYHAGAARELDLRATQIVSRLPARVRANTTPACILAGKDELYFFPDRLLVKSENQFGAVTFEELNVQADIAKLIVETAPIDGHIVGRTWRYVNKNGGPDKRFRNNSELPIVEYSILSMRSDRGLNELFYFSAPGTAESIKKSLEELSEEIKKMSTRKLSAEFAVETPSPAPVDSDELPPHDAGPESSSTSPHSSSPKDDHTEWELWQNDKLAMRYDKTQANQMFDELTKLLALRGSDGQPMVSPDIMTVVSYLADADPAKRLEIKRQPAKQWLDDRSVKNDAAIVEDAVAVASSTPPAVAERAARFFICKLGEAEARGPFDLSQIEALRTCGVIDADTHFCREGENEWKPSPL
jgi:hypothetical protein